MNRPPRPGPGRPVDRLRLLVLALLLGAGAGLIALLIRGRPIASRQPSLALPFQLLGTPVHLVDRLASRVVPVGSVEERDLGDTLRRRYDAQVDPADPDQRYLDRLLPALVRHTRRPFPYRAYRIGPCGGPNAMALPGGVLLVCGELIDRLGSEAELVAVLAHELGHSELGHCFDTVRFQLLARRSGSEPLGQLADAAVQLLVQHTYSKASEHEADDYAFSLLLADSYDPAALGRAFAALNSAVGGEPPGPDPLNDLLRSHPPGLQRQQEYAQHATAWWQAHPGARRYVGRRNLRRRLPLASLNLPQEWWIGGRDPAAVPAPPRVGRTPAPSP